MQYNSKKDWIYHRYFIEGSLFIVLAVSKRLFWIIIVYFITYIEGLFHVKAMYNNNYIIMKCTNDKHRTLLLAKAFIPIVNQESLLSYKYHQKFKCYTEPKVLM